MCIPEPAWAFIQPPSQRLYAGRAPEVPVRQGVGEAHGFTAEQRPLTRDGGPCRPGLPKSEGRLTGQHRGVTLPWVNLWGFRAAGFDTGWTLSGQLLHHVRWGSTPE
jgi:hypothetical protein